MKRIALSILTALSLTACLDEAGVDVDSETQKELAANADDHLADIDDAIAVATPSAVIPHGGDLGASPAFGTDQPQTQGATPDDERAKCCITPHPDSQPLEVDGVK
jgi:ribosomal protein L12E/L44/L45/RPP1/RPP2